jgi:hypothetical protein
MFVEKTEVVYRGMCGIIDFVGDQYVVIRLPPKPGRNSARLLVYKENQKEIIIMKESEK